MITKRIIPCLDVKDGKTVKGIQFENLREVGDPVELAAYYSSAGADELVFLDISATIENRKTFKNIVRRIAKEIDIPFTVGGGIKSIEDVSDLLNNGADKISINSTAVHNPYLINEIAGLFGSQCIVLAIDTRKEKENNLVYLNSGKTRTGQSVFDWAKEAADRGAGEILLTSMDHDGCKEGFAVELTRQISEQVCIPVIASGGAGKMEDFKDVFENGKADAALAAGIFHNKQIEIPFLKNYLNNKNIPVRI